MKSVAWMWGYVGKDPMAKNISPIARTLEELDPDNPPYPDHWQPLYPLYSSEEIAKQKEDSDMLEWFANNLMRESSMRFNDNTFKMVNAWAIASAGTDLRAAIAAARKDKESK